MKFNFDILSPIEFEELCKDIISKKLNMDFKSFKIGKDGGIDLRNKENGVICQCKHIKDYKNLISNLKKEIKKIDSIKGIKKYYLMISTRLTPKNEDDLLELMSTYLKSSEQLISLEEIELFLEKDENIEVLKKHSKLWLTSYKVLEIFESKFMDFEVSTIYNKIKEQINYFVETEVFRDCIEIILKERILVITGSPGVGKTINSNMIVAKLLSENKDLKVKTIVGSNYEELIKSLNSQDNELIILDDFLGQSYLDKTNSDLNNIVSIINYVQKNENKYLLLNSRLYVMSQTKNENEKISRVLNSLDSNKYVINMDEISLIEKTKILYNLHYFNNVPLEYFNELGKKENFYFYYRFERIINHRNYNTRIIEYCVLNYKKDSICKDKYYKYIIDNLNNPAKIWEVQFNKFTKEEISFLHTMYSISSNNVPSSILKESFNNVIKQREYDTEKNNYIRIINKMADSIITQTLSDNDILLNVINPSINDFILNDLKNNFVELERMLEESVYIEQLNNLIMLDKRLLCMVEKPLLEYKIISDDQNGVILDFILKYKYCSDDLREFIENLFVSKNYINSRLLDLLSLEKLFYFYDLKKYITDYELLIKLFNTSPNSYIKDYISFIDEYLEHCEEAEKIEINYRYNEKLSEIINEKIFEDIYNDIDYDISRITEEKLDLLECIKKDGEYHVCNLETVFDEVEEEANSIIDQKIDEEINNYCLSNIDISHNITISSDEFIKHDEIIEKLEELKLDEQSEDNNDCEESNLTIYDVFFQDYADGNNK